MRQFPTGLCLLGRGDGKSGKRTKLHGWADASKVRRRGRFGDNAQKTGTCRLCYMSRERFRVPSEVRMPVLPDRLTEGG